MNQEREPHNSFEKSAMFYLEAANSALLQGQPRLAIHLFRAAFELESTFVTMVSAPILEGLRKAWDLACELGERSMAESIFTDLSSYNSIEQNEHAGARLHALALSQLEDMGIDESDLEGISGAISQRVAESGHESFLESLKSLFAHMGVSDDEETDKAGNDPVIQKLLPASSALAKTQKEDLAETGSEDTLAASRQASAIQQGLASFGRHLRELGEKGKTDELQPRLNFETLAGYSQVIERMRQYGFLSQGDEMQRNFVERAATMHGVSRLSLDGTFFFYGPSREDVSLFAHAAAGEIGYPLLQIAVDIDAQGNGTIKLAGPFRRGFYGSPPDIMDMATPCTVLIENIDYLQTLFNNEQNALQHGGGKPRNMNMMPGMPRSMQAEISGYLRVLRQKPGIVMMATAHDLIVLKEPLLSLLGPLNQIEVGLPCEEERREVISTFASEHPSYVELDAEQIVRYSAGMSRSKLVMASHAAVEQAYRESLRSGTYNRVSLENVLVQLATHLDRGSLLYQQLEDEVIAQFSQDIEENML